MKSKDKVMKILLSLAVNRKISEFKVLDIVDEYHLGTLQYSEICDALSMQGYEIVSEEDYQKSLKEAENTTPEQPTKYDDIILKFRKLELSDKQECLTTLQAILVAEDENLQNTIAEPFMEKVKNMKLQYSYISVLLKAFFSECNAMGKADLNALIIYFDNYYHGRQKQELVSEQSDSVLGKTDFSNEDVRRIILSNPLKRSFLANYFSESNQNPPP